LNVGAGLIPIGQPMNRERVAEVIKPWLIAPSVITFDSRCPPQFIKGLTDGGNPQSDAMSVDEEGLLFCPPTMDFSGSLRIDCHFAAQFGSERTKRVL
jgi:hypothetical protein